MTEKHRKWLTYGGAGTVALIVLAYLYKARAASPGAGNGMYSPATALATPSIPPAEINLSFQAPDLSANGQPTGYVPLFGFIGWGQQWS